MFFNELLQYSEQRALFFISCILPKSKIVSEIRTDVQLWRKMFITNITGADMYLRARTISPDADHLPS